MATQGNVYPDVGRSASTEHHQAAGAIDPSAPELKAKFRNVFEAGKTRISEWKGGFEDGVREKPLQSLLIAAAVGTVIGLLIGRRSH
jgi:ElaB/YqjD/DUF883 family membrane-anchored ribosome-binding protein